MAQNKRQDRTEDDAASQAYAKLRKLRGKVKFSLTACELKDGRPAPAKPH
jgi:hypothetical protein